MTRTAIRADHLVDDVMNAYPATIRVFLRHRMACVGCCMGRFHTVADAGCEYDLPLDDLLRELREAAAGACRTEPAR